eukprot:scaffold1033_cov408-Prasinococcus_capsulatus_cf.AAC.9
MPAPANWSTRGHVRAFGAALVLTRALLYALAAPPPPPPPPRARLATARPHTHMPSGPALGRTRAAPFRVRFFLAVDTRQGSIGTDWTALGELAASLRPDKELSGTWLGLARMAAPRRRAPVWAVNSSAGQVDVRQLARVPRTPTGGGRGLDGGATPAPVRPRRVERRRRCLRRGGWLRRSGPQGHLGSRACLRHGPDWRAAVLGPRKGWALHGSASSPWRYMKPCRAFGRDHFSGRPTPQPRSVQDSATELPTTACDVHEEL